MFQAQRPVEALLRREVLPPRDPSSSLGILSVSAAALLFALASSLLLVRASSVEPAASANVRLAVPMMAPRLAPAPVDACRGPIYRARPDGRAEAVFELCAPRGGRLRIVAD